MQKKLIKEIKSIIHRYNSMLHKKNYVQRHSNNHSIYIMNIDDFEEIIDWEWVSKNYHVSHNFIYEYHDKLDMQYLFDNYVITEKDFLRKKAENEIESRFDILDI